MNTLGQQPSADDIELMNRIAQRDQTALTALYQRYGQVLYSLAFRIISNREMAEEITQDAFLTVWNHPGSWSPAGGRLSSWLLTMTRYKAIDRVRREQRRPDMNAGVLNNASLRADPAAQPDDPLLEDGRMLRSLFAQLPPEQAQAIELAFFQGMTHSAIAQYLNVPLGTVKTRVRLGLQKLRLLWDEASNTRDQS